jgi:hypothetical protein
MVALSVLAMPLPVRAASVYLIKPDDPSAVVLTKAAFPELHADGVADDTAALQRAIDQASKSLLLLTGGAVSSAGHRYSPSAADWFRKKTRQTTCLGGCLKLSDDAPKVHSWFSGGNNPHGSDQVQWARFHGRDQHWRVCRHLTEIRKVCRSRVHALHNTGS